jgi:hypothetical protein
VGIGATSSNAKLFVQSTTISTTTALFQGMAGQTADLLSIISSSAATLFSVSATGTAYLSTILNIGTTTPTAVLNISASTSAASGVAGIYQDLTFDPSSAGNYQFGNRMIVRVNPVASTSAIGQFIRMIDNTTASNTVRGLEVRVNGGTNYAGVNTGILSFGRTFGIQGITTGEAGATALPAGVYAELQNSTQGNAIRA